MIGGPLTFWPIIVRLIELGGALRAPAGMLMWGGALLVLVVIARTVRHWCYQQMC